MKTLEISILIILCFQTEIDGKVKKDCEVSNLENRYKNAIHDFLTRLFKTIPAQQSLQNANFVIALDTIWIMLAAIAEGCDQKTKQNLFNILGLPDDKCKREKFYKIATSRTNLNSHAIIENSRNLFINEHLAINSEWYELISKNSLLDVVKVPFKSTTDTDAGNHNNPKLNLTGNSVMIDTFYYKSLGSIAFKGAIVQQAPFYNEAGEEIGYVDMMKMKRRARIGQVKSINIKVLELPVDKEGLYRMLLVKALDKRKLKAVISEVKTDIICEIFDSLKYSKVPIDIAVPRIEDTSYIDVRSLLEALGVQNVWTDANVTKFISTPPAFPTSYLQQASVNVNEKYTQEPTTSKTFSRSKHSFRLDRDNEGNFIANHPFLWGLFDAKTHTPLVGVGFMKPTYTKNE